MKASRSCARGGHRCSMDRFKALRKMFNDAGVTIYALEDSSSPTMSDAEIGIRLQRRRGARLHAHDARAADDVAQLKRIGAFAEKHKVYAAYHTHLQGSMTAFDQRVRRVEGATWRTSISATTSPRAGETRFSSCGKFHDRIASFHLKDRTDAGARRGQPRVGHRRHADYARSCSW